MKYETDYWVQCLDADSTDVSKREWLFVGRAYPTKDGAIKSLHALVGKGFENESLRVVEQACKIVNTVVYKPMAIIPHNWLK